MSKNETHTLTWGAVTARKKLRQPHFCAKEKKRMKKEKKSDIVSIKSATRQKKASSGERRIFS